MYNPARFSREAWLERDLAVARCLHRVSIYRPLVRLLILASVLGDGMIWLALGIALALRGGETGRYCLLAMLLLGSINLLLYRVLKRRTSRPRPFMQYPDIRACTRALDHFSFPSGHTLHAVSFSMLVEHFFPTLTPLLWSFTSLVALSRVVLGLHYPSDVLAAAAMGLLTAEAVLNLF